MFLFPSPTHEGRARHRLLFDLVLAMHATDALGLPVCGLHLSAAIDQLTLVLRPDQLGWLEEARHVQRGPLPIRSGRLRQHLVFCQECCDDMGLMAAAAHVTMALENLR